MKHINGGSMRTQPGVDGGWAVKPRKAETLLNSQPWCYIHSQDMGHHVCMCEGPTQYHGFCVFGFFSEFSCFSEIYYYLHCLNSQPLHI